MIYKDKDTGELYLRMGLKVHDGILFARLYTFTLFGRRFWYKGKAYDRENHSEYLEEVKEYWN